MLISEARKKTSKTWRTVEVDWAEFTAKLREPLRTGETTQEYRRMSKADKDIAKAAAGGFVGGDLGSGRRVSQNLRSRSMITLDADNAKPDSWEFGAMMVPYRMCCYTTHSHTSEAPRIRWIVPTSRDMTPDEYPAVARRVAEWLDMDTMDPTTFDTVRLFYYPTCSRDAKYGFWEQEGPLLDPDEILASYGRDDAWKDARLWPTAKTETEVQVREAKRQGEPTEKPGIVGLFCRTYDVPGAIDAFLSDVYTEGNHGRYTYAAGSTADGAVLYNDGAFLYSHHGTDPCGGQLVNAFDLVRIHLFGDLDAEGDGETEITKRASYKRMCEFAAEDAEVKKALAEENASRAEAAFADLVGGECDAESEEGDKDDWKKQLQVDKKGVFVSSIDNIRLIVVNDALLKGKLLFNEFSGRLYATGALPWKKEPHVWEDADSSCLRWYLEKFWNIKGKDAVKDALNVLTQTNKIHPVREYLKGLTWDGVERLDTMLIDYLAAEDTPFTRAVTRKWMVAACKRVFEPGCKFDTMLVLVSPQQGAGKSMLGDTLAGEWFKDGLKNLNDKDAMQELQGKWIIEMGEMAATRKSSNEVIKQSISCRLASYRKSFGEFTGDRPRQCVFIGSTNNREFIMDETGGRRFGPVEAHAGPETSVQRIEKLRQDRDQLWAEAMVRYRGGEKVWLDDPELLKESLAEQERFSQTDEWLGLVQEYLDTPLPPDWADWDIDRRRDYIQGTDLTTEEQRARYTQVRDQVSIAEIRYELLWDDPKKGAGGNNETSRHLGRVMNVMPGWELAKNPRKTPFGRQKVYQRGGREDSEFTRKMGEVKRRRELHH